ncbi:TPA: oligosaccharide flippase family protein, partial [Enterococcus faecium]|nr:oligosaccharide flippase family protein [Enterococcus faecium]
MSKTKYLIKNMGILTISNFSSKILVFLLVPLYTSVLSTTEYGTYDLTISTATLL